MSTWINKAILAMVLLSGCVAPGGGAALLTGAQTAEPRRTIVLDGMKIAGPQGFCPVQTSRQRVGQAEFVALAPCSGTQGAILAATIGAPGSAAGVQLSAAVLEPYFGTPEGQRALRGEGNDDMISVHEVRDLGGAVVLRLTREGTARVGDSWRALLQIDGRLITLSVRPRQGGSLPPQDGRRLIERFVAAMRGANQA
jgi:hypothetical protein